MAQRRSLEERDAADNSVSNALTVGWSAFHDYVDNQVGERAGLSALSQVRDQIEEACSSPTASRTEAPCGRSMPGGNTLTASRSGPVAALTCLDWASPR